MTTRTFAGGKPRQLPTYLQRSAVLADVCDMRHDERPVIAVAPTHLVGAHPAAPAAKREGLAVLLQTGRTWSPGSRM